jgi:hypothetical protein
MIVPRGKKGLSCSSKQLKPFFPLRNNNILGEKKLKLFQGVIMMHPQILG